MHKPPPTRPPADVSSDAEGARAGFGTRVATLLGVSALASLVAAIPAAIRIANADAGASGARVWLALAAGAVLPAAASVAILRGARGGLRAFGGDGGGARTFGFGLWLVATFATLVLYGGVLRATTHHHALAGVTFALGALVIAGASALLVGRFVAIAQTQSPGARTVLFGVLTFVVTFVLIGGAAPAARVILPRTGGLLLDGLAFAIAVAFASQATFADRRALAFLGPPVAASVLAFGFAIVHISPTLADAIHERAPLFAATTDLTRH